MEIDKSLWKKPSSMYSAQNAMNQQRISFYKGLKN